MVKPSGESNILAKPEAPIASGTQDTMMAEGRDTPERPQEESHTEEEPPELRSRVEDGEMAVWK